MSSTSLATRRTLLGAAAVLGMVGAGVVAAPLASAASVPGTLSVSSGPSGGGNALTLTTKTTAFAAGTVVEFQYAATATSACSPAYSAPVAVTATAGVVVASSPKVLAGNKLAFTVPATVALQGAATSANWLVCVYPGTSTTTSLLTSSAKYTIAAAPTVTAVAPASGPALGGGTVTLTGTGFTAGTTARIGSALLTGVTVVNNTTLTGTVPAQAAGAAMAVSVTNTGGTANLAGAYTYKNGVVVSPATAVGGSAAGPTDVDVQGVGFSSLNFTATSGTTPDSANAHVYLVQDGYDATGFVAGTSNKANGEATECVNVLVISDGELICTVDTSKKVTAASGTATYATGTLPNGTYTLTVVGNGAATAPTYQTVVSSGATFTVADF